VPDRPPTEPLPKKSKGARSAPVPVLVPDANAPLTADWIESVLIMLESGLVPYVVKNVADADGETIAAIDALATAFFTASQALGEAQEARENEDDEVGRR
jgi:hypothetical protein